MSKWEVTQEQTLICFGKTMYVKAKQFTVTKQDNGYPFTVTMADGNRYTFNNLDFLQEHLVFDRAITKVKVAKPGDICVTMDGTKYRILKQTRDAKVTRTFLGTTWEFDGMTFHDYKDYKGYLLSRGYIEEVLPDLPELTPIGSTAMVDLRVTADGTYWIGKVGAATNTMNGWRRIGLGDITRDASGQAWVKAKGLTLKVRNTHGSKEVNKVNVVDALQAQADALAIRIAEEREKERIRDAALALEPRSDDPDSLPVVYWEENFGRDEGPTYTYVAVRAKHGMWYTSKQGGGAMSWASLIEKYHSLRHGDFWVAGEWVRPS